jgi:Transposase IS116/IS110/IS902 family
MNARHRVSKMLLRHGRVHPKTSTWTQEHRRWLSAQRFPEPVSELAWADLVACVDGLTARKRALAERIGELATDPAWWPTVARLRAFRGVDTLTAFAIHLELGADWARFEKAHRVGSWLGLIPSREQSGPSVNTTATDRSPRPAPRSRAGCWSSPPGTPPANRGSARPSPTASKDNPTTCCRLPTVPASAYTASTPACAPAASPQRDGRRSRPGAGLLPLGRCHRTLTLLRRTAAPPAQEAGTPGRHRGRHAR